MPAARLTIGVKTALCASAVRAVSMLRVIVSLGATVAGYTLMPMVGCVMRPTRTVKIVNMYGGFQLA